MVVVVLVVLLKTTVATVTSPIATTCAKTPAPLPAAVAAAITTIRYKLFCFALLLLLLLLYICYSYFSNCYSSSSASSYSYSSTYYYYYYYCCCYYYYYYYYCYSSCLFPRALAAGSQYWVQQGPAPGVWQAWHTIRQTNMEPPDKVYTVLLKGTVRKPRSRWGLLKTNVAVLFPAGLYRG